MKKITLLAAYFFLTPTLLFISIIYFLFLQSENQGYISHNLEARVAYAALPGTPNSLNGFIISKDARIYLVSEFFASYKSELKPFAENVVKDADKYGIDYRLVPAIAMQESNLCKKAPKDLKNCWGYGIYGKNSIKFDDYNQAINSVSKTLGEYKKLGLVTPEEIMTKYTPSSNGSWARGVIYFMEELSI